MSKVDVSIVFRALNEEKFFGQSLEACKKQILKDGKTFEIILVDSGSTDRTLEIAKEYGCKIVHISRQEFSFGRSLNWGCEAAQGEHLVLISAHCIPDHKYWLQNLIAPLEEGVAEYTYGRQLGCEFSKFSEKQLFAKYFPEQSQIPQDGFFVNNANSALLKSTWKKIKFDEEVTGLEDMVLGKALVQSGGKIAYVADAPVLHIHEESMSQTKRRYYREALTLREVMPNVHMYKRDFLRYLFTGIIHDLGVAAREKVFFKKAKEIVLFRTMQFMGSYKGHNETHKLSREQKEAYYYPRVRSKNKSSSSNKASNTVVVDRKA